MRTNALTSVNFPEVWPAKQLLSSAAIKPVSSVLGATFGGARFRGKVIRPRRLVDDTHRYILAPLLSIRWTPGTFTVRTLRAMDDHHARPPVFVAELELLAAVSAERWLLVTSIVGTQHVHDLHHAHLLVLATEHRLRAVLRGIQRALATSTEGTHLAIYVYHTHLFVFPAVFGPPTTFPPEARVGGTGAILAKTHVQRLETVLQGRPMFACSKTSLRYAAKRPLTCTKK